MKKAVAIAMFLVLVITLIGCDSSAVEDSYLNDEPGIVGYVMERDGDRILVINPEPQDFSGTGGVSEYYDAIWFENAPNDINMGEKVKVWYDIVRDSYPGQSEAMHIEVIPSQKPEGANLTESEALYRALTSQEIHSDSILAVKSIEYDSKTKKWEIKLKEIWSEAMHELQIDDEK